jgi:hypothetical protein
MHEFLLRVGSGPQEVTVWLFRQKADNGPATISPPAQQPDPITAISVFLVLRFFDEGTSMANREQLALLKHSVEQTLLVEELIGQFGEQ